ncbi:MAG: hypothetical protein E7432_01085 [Ruminococcaceae bacterium]|nr:hypothetical protein [Oscillospiraceae bacterium]
MLNILYFILGFAPVGVGAVMLFVGMGDVPVALSLIGWPIFLFLWGIIGYFMRKYAINPRFSCIMLHIPMSFAVILSLFPKIPSAIEETLLIVIMSTGFWSVLPRLIINELWFFMLFYLAVMVLSWYIGYKLADWKTEN